MCLIRIVFFRELTARLTQKISVHISPCITRACKMSSTTTTKTSLLSLGESLGTVLLWRTLSTWLFHSRSTLDSTLRRKVSGPTTLETHSSRAAQLRCKRLVLSVIKVDPAIRTSTHVVDTVFQHQFLSHSILVKRTIHNYTAFNCKRDILPCPDGTCTIHVLLETFLQVVGSPDVILSVLQLKHVQSMS